MLLSFKNDKALNTVTLGPVALQLSRKLFSDTTVNKGETLVFPVRYYLRLLSLELLQ